MALLTPLPADQWNRAKAAHLLNRAAFGGAPEQIEVLSRLGFAAAVHNLVDGPLQPVSAPPPDWARPTDRLVLRERVRQAALMAMSASPRPAIPNGPGVAGAPVTPDTNFDQSKNPAVRQAVQEVRKQQRQMEHGQIQDLVAWWLHRMATSPDPVQEKLTLFWHGHFATSAQKVKDAYLMWRQNETLREHSRGNFGAMVKAMSRDPAMLFWLDLQQSKPEHPNENFARELMELFTLGEGHYTEPDILESARAFTGYRIDPRSESFVFAPAQHDRGPKKFFGLQGNFNGDDIIDIILGQPACAEFIARKLWTFYAYEDPSPEIVATLAQTLRGNGYELRPALHQLFTSAEFYSDRAIRNQIKSPVQWLVQSARSLEIDMPSDPRLLMGALRQLGQVPFIPPSVKGWDGGKSWISTSSLLIRYNYAGALLRGTGAPLPHPPGPATPVANTMAMNDATHPAPPPGVPKPAIQSRVDFARVAPAPLRGDVDTLVHALTLRLFQDPLTARQTQAFGDYLRAHGGHVTDQDVLGLLHLMMSTPQFQLC